MDDNFVLKSRQHYVFQEYLRNWIPNPEIDNRLWMKMKGKKPVKVGTKDVLFQKNFYRLRKMNGDEYKLFELLIGKERINPNVWRQIEQHVKDYQTLFEYYPFLNCLEAEATTTKNKENRKQMVNNIAEQRKQLDVQINNLDEDFYCEIEGELIKSIRLICSGNVQFYEEEEKRQTFLTCVCMQYFRTKKLEINGLLLYKIYWIKVAIT